MADDDDKPTRDNSPGTESDSNDDEEDADRILDLIGKHRKEIQAKMTHNERNFRSVLKERVERGERKHAQFHLTSPNADLTDTELSRESSVHLNRTSAASALQDLRRTSSPNTLRQSFVQAYVNSVNHAESAASRYEMQREGSQLNSRSGSNYYRQESQRKVVTTISSDEYFEPPQRRKSSKGLIQYTYPYTLPDLKGSNIGSRRPVNSSASNQAAAASIQSRSKSDTDHTDSDVGRRGNGGGPGIPGSAPSNSKPSMHRSSTALAWHPVEEEGKDECIFKPDEEDVESNCSSCNDNEDTVSVTFSENRTNNNRVTFNARVTFEENVPRKRSNELLQRDSPTDTDSEASADSEREEAEDDNNEARTVRDPNKNVVVHPPDHGLHSVFNASPDSYSRSPQSSNESVEATEGNDYEPTSGSPQSLVKPFWLTACEVVENAYNSVMSQSWEDWGRNVQENYWRTMVIAAIFLLCVSLAIMTREYSQNPIPETSQVKPQLFKHKGPIM